MLTLLDGLKASDLEPTHILWIQGEADRLKESRFREEGAYLEAFSRLLVAIRARTSAPILISLASSCPSDLEPTGPAIGIRRAQMAAISKFPGAFRGVDFDGITGFEERTHCHLTETGLARATKEMLAAMMAASR